MTSIAKLNYLRIAPRKMRLLADMIRGKKADKALSLLAFSIRKGALPMSKLLKSSIANAKNNQEMEESSLVISKITVDEGSKLKRWRARSRGRAAPIQKKTSKITLVLEGNAIVSKEKKEKTDKNMNGVSKVKSVPVKVKKNKVLSNKK